MMGNGYGGGSDVGDGESPTIRRRQLGAQLREVRRARKLTGEQVAEELEWDKTKVYRIESGKQGIRPKELRELLDVLEVTDPDAREQYFAAAREGKRKGWWSTYGPLPKVYETYIGIETEAVEMRIWEPLVVHGLLQTESYASAIIRGSVPGITDEEVDRQVRLRLARQERLREVHLWLILGESTLRLAVGGTETLREQLEHLRSIARRPQVTLQVVPFSEGAHGGLRGAFTVLSLPDGQVTYAETLAGDIYPEGEEARACSLVFDHLRARALSPDRTVALIDETLRQL